MACFRRSWHSNAASSFSRESELRQISKQSCQQIQWQPARLKANASTAVSERHSNSRQDSASSDGLSSRKDRQSDLVHPLFSKGKQKEKTAIESKPSKLSPGSLSARKGSVPAPKPELKPLKASSKPSVGSSAAESQSKPASRKQAASKKAAASTVSDTQQAPTNQSARNAREKGPKTQVAFAPQPTKLRMAPTSPDAIADPYQ